MPRISSISPYDDSSPAPYAFGTPSSRRTPNSIENQKTFDTNSSASADSTRRAAPPASRYSAANRRRARAFACPTTSCTTSGSGVYSGTEWCRMYCVE